MVVACLPNKLGAHNGLGSKPGADSLNFVLKVSRRKRYFTTAVSMKLKTMIEDKKNNYYYYYLFTRICQIQSIPLIFPKV